MIEGGLAAAENGEEAVPEFPLRQDFRNESACMPDNF